MHCPRRRALFSPDIVPPILPPRYNTLSAMADEKPTMTEGVPGGHHYPAVDVGTGKSADLDGAHAKKVHNAELFAAVQETQIKKWRKETFHLYFAVFVAFCCACANGYDGSLMTGIIAMEHFQSTFHTSSTGTQVAVMYSLYTV